MINMFSSLLFVAGAVLAVEHDPATTGKYFYSDFYLERQTGFHEMGMQNGKGKDAYFWMMLTLDTDFTGLFLDKCV